MRTCSNVSLDVNDGYTTVASRNTACKSSAERMVRADPTDPGAGNLAARGRPAQHRHQWQERRVETLTGCNPLTSWFN